MESRGRAVRGGSFPPSVGNAVLASQQSQFAVYAGTDIQCDLAGGKVTVTLSSDARPVLLRVLTKEPVAVTRDGLAVPELAEEQEHFAGDLFCMQLSSVPAFRC